MESGVTSTLVMAGAPVLSACSILFERTAHMAPTTANLVTKLSDVMKKNPDLKVPWSGTPTTQANNLQPSQRRVKAMVDALVKDGVAADRIAAVGVGRLSPVAPNDRPEGARRTGGWSLS